MVKATDVEGMTMLHHAVNGKNDERAAARAAAASAGGETHSVPGPFAEGKFATDTGGGDIEEQASEHSSFSLDRRSSVIRSVLAFARKTLWMPEVCITQRVSLFHVVGLSCIRLLFSSHSWLRGFGLPQVSRRFLQIVS